MRRHAFLHLDCLRPRHSSRFFRLMAGRQDGWAPLIALDFMRGTFGQIPIDDLMIAKLAPDRYCAIAQSRTRIFLTQRAHEKSAFRSP
jgi:hypothetical protein